MIFINRIIPVIVNNYARVFKDSIPLIQLNLILIEDTFQYSCQNCSTL